MNKSCLCAFEVVVIDFDYLEAYEWRLGSCSHTLISRMHEALQSSSVETIKPCYNQDDELKLVNR